MGGCFDVPRFPWIGREGSDWGPRGDVVECHDAFLGIHSGVGVERCGLLGAIWFW